MLQSSIERVLKASVVLRVVRGLALVSQKHFSVLKIYHIVVWLEVVSLATLE